MLDESALTDCILMVVPGPALESSTSAQDGKHLSFRSEGGGDTCWSHQDEVPSLQHH